MFTGLIQDIGRVKSIDRKGDWVIVLETKIDRDNLMLGASISCSGCCLTVIESGPGWFAVQASMETISKTNLKDWAEGTLINLEPSLRMGDELGGHFVFGHVDAVATLENIQPDQDSRILTIRAPEALMPFVAPKGSVTLDGISLTVNDVVGQTFTVNIIPHTWTHTALSGKNPGDALNFEVDMLARYVARMAGKAA